MQTAIFDEMGQCTEESVAHMLPLVSAQRREQALRYRHLFGRFCCLKSWLMVSDLLRPAYGMEMPAVWHYNEHGKPFLPDGPFFSVSHCKSAIAVAVAEESVGIDVESVRHADAALVDRTMSAAEQVWLREAGQHTETERNRLFTRLWTQKEAVFKWRGTGIPGFEELQSVLSESGFVLETTETDRYIVSLCTAAPKKEY